VVLFVVFVLALVVCLIGIWFFQRYFAKASRDVALVRTGVGGQRVILDGGCFAVPIFHQIQKVSMGAMTISLNRKGPQSLMTGDHLRVDVEMAFEFRVAPNADSVSLAAQSLGSRIARAGADIERLLSSAIINAMQNAAAHRDLNSLHKGRAVFTDEVSEAVSARMEKLGLELISGALVTVDQSDLSQLNDKNIFNAEGMRRVAGLVADQRKERVKIETETEISVRESQLVEAQRRLDIQRSERETEIAQQEHLARLEAESRSLSEVSKIEAEQASETARLDQQLSIAASKVANDEKLRRAEMTAILKLEENKIANEMQLARMRSEEAAVKAEEESSRAQVLLASESVQKQKEKAIAERDREISLIKVEKDLAIETAKVKSATETQLVKSAADAKAVQSKATADLHRMEAEAKGRAAQISAENALSDAVIAMRLEERKLDRLPEIMTQMMKPVEKIDSIRINQIGGMGGSSNEGQASGVDGAFGAAMDQILGMAVRLPAMKKMGEEIGVDFDPNIAGRTADYANRIKTKTEDKK
jgi:flotillin